jgi:hypothetical protein
VDLVPSGNWTIDREPGSTILNVKSERADTIGSKPCRIRLSSCRTGEQRRVQGSGQDQALEISVGGQMRSFPSIRVDNRNVILTGGFIKVARVHDEPFVQGEAVPNPELFIEQLSRSVRRPDIFVFAQRFTESEPKYKYPMEWDSFAVAPVTTYEHWLQKQAKKDVRENLRRAAREGVVVKTCEYNDEFAWHIKKLYDDTPVRQGRPFWHYQKSFDKVKKENGSYADRSEYIGAFFEQELIGFMKMVYVGDYAKTMQVIAKDRYFYKRPANAMIAKAIEVCAQKGIKYFNYGFYEYPGKKENSLTKFKARHGLLRFNFPRYYVPLTLKGKIYVALGLHRGLKRLIPTPILVLLLKIRSSIHEGVVFAGKRQLTRTHLAVRRSA